jgi:hypothetical protein
LEQPPFLRPFASVTDKGTQCAQRVGMCKWISPAVACSIHLCGTLQEYLCTILCTWHTWNHEYVLQASLIRFTSSPFPSPVSACRDSKPEGGSATAISEAHLAALEDAIRDAVRATRSVYEGSKELLMKLFRLLGAFVHIAKTATIWAEL